MKSITSIFDSYQIIPIFNQENPSIKVSKDEQETIFSGPQIKWGITSTGKSSDFININPSELVFFVYSPKNNPPTNLWVFKKIDDFNDLQIVEAQKLFLRATSLSSNMEGIENSKNKNTVYINQKDSIDSYEKAIIKYKKSIEKLEKENIVKNEGINNLILLIKRDLFFLQMDYERDLYLKTQELKKIFDESIKNYRKIHFNDAKKMFTCCVQFIQAKIEEKNSARYLTRAIIHEVLDQPFFALEAYLLTLSQDIDNADICIKKIKDLITNEKKKKNESFFDFLENLDRDLLVALYSKTKDPLFERLLFEKDITRIYFEKSLEIVQEKSIRKGKNCFICFALETNVENWLTKVFVPDLKKMGIEPIYGPWHLAHGGSLNSFQSKIRDSDLALIIGTPRLKDICTERFKEERAITGSAQEIQIAQERYNDADKNGTIFTLTLHGKRKDCIPTPMLESIFTGKLEVTEEKEGDLYDYYSKAFRIFACLAKMNWPEPGKSAGELKEAFVKAAGEIVFADKVSDDLKQKVQQWGEDRYRPKFTLSF